MFTSFAGWIKNLPRIGKIALILVVLGSVSAFAAPSSEQPTAQPATPEQPTSVTTTETVIETESIPFAKKTLEDSSLAKGATKITAIGVNGEKTFTYKSTLTDSKETSRELVSEEVTTAPIDEVTSIGTYIAPPPPKPASVPTSNCDSNYSGCVPIASDVDCAGGSGDGPAYTGMVQVIGNDVYGLDRDGNGWACE